MIRLIALLSLLLVPALAGAEDAPVLTTELAETETTAGQPLILRVTVLVPTFLPKPPVFPSFEVPNVIVRLPERASGPVSERRGGETWSGVRRSYRLYPMVPGEFEIPAQPVRITYADPETNDPVTVDLASEPIRFTATVPAGAEGLDPFIAATALTLEQTIDGTPERMKVGDALTRTVTAEVSGLSPIFLPALIPAAQIDGLAVYPSEPVVTEREDRGVLSGTRIETVTYVPEAGGEYALPGLSLSWFDLDSEAVQTAEIPPIAFSVEAGPAGGAETETGPPALTLLGGIAILVALLFSRSLHVRVANGRAAWYRSEPACFRRLTRSLRAGEPGAIFAAYDDWLGSLDMTRIDRTDLDDAIAAMNASRFSKGPSTAPGNTRTRAIEVARRTRRAVKRQRSARHNALPLLNPEQTA